MEAQLIPEAIPDKDLLSLSQKHKCETDRYEQLERFHIFVRSRENVECEEKNRT